MRNEAAALFTGGLIAIMVAANGMLAARVGLWMSVLIIHVCGLATICLILLARRRRFTLRAPGLHWTLYAAGAVGVLTTLLNNLCYEPLGAALMLALCVVGQLFCSNLIDHFGWFGMRRYPFRPAKLIGFAGMAGGLAHMTITGMGAQGASALTLGSAVLYAVLALFTGALLAFTTTVNAALGKRIGVFPGALVNYLTGLGTTLACMLVLGGFSWAGIPGTSPFLFSGGVLGLIIVAITSAILPRIPVVYVTVILFTGQILVGIGIDAVGGVGFTAGKLAGCAVVAAGLLYNMQTDRRAATPAG